MKKRLFPFIVALAALSVAGSAAFYSVFGLSKLFAGASTEVIIMAGSLEFAKLVVASLLYQYWDTIHKVLKGYLMIACFVLMVITSGGIYGFLSGAYQSTATQSELLDKSLLILEQKQVRFEEQKTDLTLEKTQINQSISDLRTSLSNPHSVSWYDKNSETVITSSSGSARRALQAELKTTITDRDNINLKLEAVLDSIGKTDMALLEKEISNEDQRELGPLKYLASTTGWPMDKVVNYFLLLIVFVFDPLAIALVVAANMAFAQIKRKEPEVELSVPEGLEFNKSYTIPPTDEIFDELEDMLPEAEEEVTNKRMDIIGQNGNDGLHYDNATSNRYDREEYLEEVNQSIHKELFEEEKSDIEQEHITRKNEDYVPPQAEEEEENEKSLAESPDPINPSEGDLKKLQTYLDNLKTPTLDRLTDTTKTLIVEKDELTSPTILQNQENIKNRMEEDNAHRGLRYRKRKE